MEELIIKTLERRTQIATLTPSDGKKLTGYASVVNSPYEVKDLHGKTFTEVVRPGAFSRALKESQDVVALFNHDANSLLGRSSSGTLKLLEDNRGLYFAVDLPDTELGRSISELTKRGDLQGASFGFFVKKDKWEGSTRQILDVDLVDVSIVTHPASPKTNVSVRMKNQEQLNKYRLKLLELENN